MTIDLYTWTTPNGRKVSIMLEECGLDYSVHPVNIGEGEQFAPEFLKISPNNRIPAIVDPDGPANADGSPFSLFESGAILVYLAEKTGQFLPADPRGRYEVLQWLMFQMGGVGPLFGQLGFFVKFKGAEVQDPIPRERYVNEALRLLGVVETALEGREWIAGEYSIADMALAPWLRALDFYGAKDLVGWDGHPRTVAYLDRFLARPAVQRALDIPPRNG